MPILFDAAVLGADRVELAQVAPLQLACVRQCVLERLKRLSSSACILSCRRLSPRCPAVMYFTLLSLLKYWPSWSS
eukprot:4508466-Prymnesium_polylepis.1